MVVVKGVVAVMADARGSYGRSDGGDGCVVLCDGDGDSDSRGY